MSDLPTLISSHEIVPVDLKLLTQWLYCVSETHSLKILLIVGLMTVAPRTSSAPRFPIVTISHARRMQPIFFYLLLPLPKESAHILISLSLSLSLHSLSLLFTLSLSLSLLCCSALLPSTLSV